MFAYKPEDEDLRFADFGSNELETNAIESAPVYTEQPMKAELSSANNLRIGAH